MMKWIRKEWMSILVYGTIGMLVMMLIVSWWGKTLPLGPNWDKPITEMTMGDVSYVLFLPALMHGYLTRTREEKEKEKKDDNREKDTRGAGSRGRSGLH